MGDTTDGPSLAAQSALPDEALTATAEPRDDDAAEPGFFGRLVQALSPQDEATAIEETPAERLSVGAPGMVNLRRMRVEDVLTPKADIVAVPDSITRDDLVAVFRESGLTRLPAFSGTLDTPLGFVHLKDFALMHGFNGAGGGFALSELIRPALFVPPSMPIGVLLTKMQTERIHIALVIDEYGGVDGLVTIEDLIEQVIGEIEDEHDAEEGAFWSEEKPGCYLVEAKAPLEEFEALIGVNLTDAPQIDGEEIDTLGGLVFMLTGRVPARGEMVPHPAGPEFEVLDADPRRVNRLRVHVPDYARG